MFISYVNHILGLIIKPKKSNLVILLPMKKLLFILLLIQFTVVNAQDCGLYTSVGTTFSGYIAPSDPGCSVCLEGDGLGGAWTGVGCTGNIVSTCAPTLSLTLAYFAVNTDDYATIAIDGGGVMSLSGVHVGVAGAVIGPYLCSDGYGDVYLTVNSTIPFTTVTLTNTGCSSGWVITCPGDLAIAGSDNTDTTCADIVVLSDLLSGDATPGGVWSEPVVSGGFDLVTTEFDPTLVGLGTYTFEYTVVGCDGSVDVAEFTVIVESSANAGADNDTIVCAGIVVLEDLLSGDAELGGVWTETTGSGAFDPITTEFNATLAGVGTYTFEYLFTACAGVTDLANFTVSVGPGGSAGPDNVAEICNSPGETIDLNTLLVGADPGGIWDETTTSGAFNPITGVFSASGLAGGDYVFTYTFPVALPCIDDVAEFVITVNPRPVITIVSTPASATICLGDDITLTASGAGVGGSYVWDHPITNGTPFTPGAGVDTYEVTATDANGCVNIEDITITVNLVPSVIFSADTLFGCDPLAVNFSNLTILPGISCLWTFGDGTSSTSCGAVSHTYVTAGIFDVSLTVNSTALCGSTANYLDYIEVRNQPVAAFSYLPNPIDIEDTEVEFSNSSLNATQYSWFFDDGSAISNEFEPIHVFPIVPNETYQIMLIAGNDIGCADTIVKPLTILDVIIFYVPNTFTPDGDDFNEIFKPIMTSGVDIFDYHLTMFNRWGEILFESYNLNSGWNGTYRDGKLVEDGTYIWQIEFGDTRSDKVHTYNGHVIVMR